MAERLYTRQQVADLLGATEAAVDRWIQTGWLEVEQLTGGCWISERGLVRFLKDRGVDLERVLTTVMAREAERQREAQEEPSSAPQARPQPSAPAASRTIARGGTEASEKLAEAILRDALQRGARAIYLEPQAEGLSLKLNVDGVVREKPHFASRLPRPLVPLLMARFCSLGGIAGGRRQEGMFRATLDGRPRSFFITTCPAPCGQGLVIRPGRA